MWIMKIIRTVCRIRTIKIYPVMKITAVQGKKIRLQLQEVAAAIMMTAHRWIMETPAMNRAAHRRIIFSLPEVFHGLTPLFLMPMKA